MTTTVSNNQPIVDEVETNVKSETRSEKSDLEEE